MRNSSGERENRVVRHHDLQRLKNHHWTIDRPSVCVVWKLHNMLAVFVNGGLAVKLVLAICLYLVFGVTLVKPEPIRMERLPTATPASEASESTRWQSLSVGFLLYDGYELLDAAGPMEMFGSLANALGEGKAGSAPGRTLPDSNHRPKPVPLPEQGPVSVFTVAEKKTVTTPSVFNVTVDYTFDNAPKIDLLIVPGGLGARTQINHEPFMKFLTQRATDAHTVLTVCTGSALLAKTGLLDGHSATSNKQAFEWVMTTGSNVNWLRRGRWVHSGKYFTSAGVSAGMDAALAVMAHLRTVQTSQYVAQYAEYKWTTDPNDDPFCELYMGDLCDE